MKQELLKGPLSEEQINSFLMSLSFADYDKYVDYFYSSILKNASGSYYDLPEEQSKIFDDIIYTLSMLFVSLLSISLPPNELKPIEDRFFSLTKEPPENISKMFSSLKSFKILSEIELAKISLVERSRLHQQVVIN